MSSHRKLTKCNKEYSQEKSLSLIYGNGFKKSAGIIIISYFIFILFRLVREANHNTKDDDYIFFTHDQTILNSMICDHLTNTREMYFRCIFSFLLSWQHGIAVYTYKYERAPRLM